MFLTQLRCLVAEVQGSCGVGAVGEDTPVAVLVQLSKADSCTAGRGFLKPGSYLRS